MRKWLGLALITAVLALGAPAHAQELRIALAAEPASAQVVAQMLTRVGIKTDMLAMPRAVYFASASKLEFSLMLLGWGADTGEPSSPLKSLLATNDPPKGMGTANRGRYSNPKLDALLQEALATVDDEKPSGLLQQATEAGIQDTGIIPLHYEVTLWGMRNDLTFEGNTNQYTQAVDIHPVQK